MTRTRRMPNDRIPTIVLTEDDVHQVLGACVSAGRRYVGRALTRRALLVARPSHFDLFARVLLGAARYEGCLFPSLNGKCACGDGLLCSTQETVPNIRALRVEACLLCLYGEPDR